MSTRKPGTQKVPAKLHPRNIHQGRYNFAVLVKASPGLIPFVIKNPSGQKTIDFSDERAVIALNKALLSQFYQVDNWSIPEGFLCPPIPGRADYIHHAADLLAGINKKRIPKGPSVNVLDIGTGANVIYPIIGCVSYGWKFTATDINEQSYLAAKGNIENTQTLKNLIRIVKQNDAQYIFKGIIQNDDRFSLTICNPPFHGSAQEAQAGTVRKVENLAKHRAQTNKKMSRRPQSAVSTNFGGQHSELWCIGGEVGFIRRMIRESIEFKTNVCWFTCLVSKNEHLRAIKKSLKDANVTSVEIVKMAQGQKVSRFVAWSYLTQQQRDNWFSAI